MNVDIVNTGPCQDADVNILFLLAEYADSPEVRQVRNRSDTVSEPIHRIFFHCVSAEDDQHLLMGEQFPVHRIEGVRDQIPVKRIVEENAFAIQ